MTQTLLALLLTCGGSQAPEEATLAAAAPAEMGEEAPCHEELEAAEPSATSFYQLTPSLTDSEGKPLAFDAHRGHPVVVSMIYTRCTTACPMIMGTLQAFDASLTPQQQRDMRYLLVSLDPERDDAAALTEARERYGLDERYTLARPGSEADLREIAAVLGVRYRRLPDGEVHHASVFTLLDPQGETLARVEGPRASTAPLQSALAALGEQG